MPFRPIDTGIGSTPTSETPIAPMTGGGLPSFSKNNGGAPVTSNQQEDSFIADHPVLKKVSDFLGTTGLAKYIAQGVLQFTPQGEQMLKDIREGRATYQDFQNAVGTQATKKQAIGSAVQMGANILAAGSLPGGAPTGVLSKIPGLTKGLSVADTLATATGLEGGKLLGTKLALRALEGGGLGYAFDVGNKLSQDKLDFTPGLGTGIGATLPFLTALVGGLAKRTVGITSGAGKDVIQRALDNPDAVAEAAKNFAQTPEAKQVLVDRARAAISDFVHGKSSEFGSAINKMVADNPLYKDEATKLFSDAVAKFNGRIDDAGELVFADTTLTNNDQSNLVHAWEKLKNWQDVTPKGFEKLRQAIGNFMDDYKIQGNDRANVVLGDFKKGLTNYIGENIPGYTDALKTYGSKSETVKSVLKELSLGGNAKPSTQLNSILKIFKKDPQVLENLNKIMGPKEADAFLNEISGAILSDWIPTGRVGNAVRLMLETGGLGAGLLGHPGFTEAAIAGAAASSPRIIGKAATMAGKAAEIGIPTALRRLGTKAASDIGN